MSVRAVVFDLFDTLVDLLSEEIPIVERGGRRLPAFVMRLYDEVASATGVALDRFVEVSREADAELRAVRYAQDLEVPTELRMEHILERLGVRDAALTQRMVEVHMGGLRAQVRELAHHADVLSAIAADVRTAVCSNFSHSPTALAVLESAALSAHLDAVVVSDAVGIRKPRAEIFEAVLGELGVTPDETLHVGDSLSADVGGAAALGIRTVWLTRRVVDPEAALRAWQGPRPDFEIADLAALPDLVRRAASG